MVILDYGATDNVKNRDNVHRNGSECQADDMKQEADSETRWWVTKGSIWDSQKGRRIVFTVSRKTFHSVLDKFLNGGSKHAIKTHHVSNRNLKNVMSLVYHVKYEIPMLTIFLCTVPRICFKRSQKQQVCVQYYYCYDISLNAENVLLCGTHTHIYVCRVRHWVVADALTLYCRCCWMLSLDR